MEGGRSRAVAVVRRPSGEVLYFNDRALALAYAVYGGEACAPAGDHLQGRLDLAAAALDAHEALNIINGCPAHSLGMATKGASDAGLLTKTESRALRSVRRKANVARHVWPDAAAGVGAPGLAASPACSASSSSASGTTPKSLPSSPREPAQEAVSMADCGSQTESTLANTLVLTKEELQNHVHDLAARSVGDRIAEFLDGVWGLAVSDVPDVELSSATLSVIEETCKSCVENATMAFRQQVAGGRDVIDCQVSLERFVLREVGDKLFEHLGFEEPYAPTLARAMMVKARMAVLALTSEIAGPPMHRGKSGSEGRKLKQKR